MDSRDPVFRTLRVEPTDRPPCNLTKGVWRSELNDYVRRYTASALLLPSLTSSTRTYAGPGGGRPPYLPLEPRMWYTSSVVEAATEEA
jgi:hypothetical protein